jgi:ATP-dependent Clp protease ATP-binding subunit ClpA
VFDRFSQNARLAVFAARHHATELSSPELGTEHLLLGVMKYEQVLIPAEVAEKVRRRAGEIAMRVEKVPLQSEMAFTTEAKKALALADEVAKRWRHPCTDVVHVLWALAMDPATSAGRILTEVGITVARVETQLRNVQAR